MKNLFLPLLLILGLNSVSQDFKLEPGAEFGYNSTITEQGTYPSTQEYTFHFKALGRDASQNYKLSCTLVRMKAKVELAKNFVNEFNSDELKKTNLNSTYPLLPLSIIQQSFFVILSPHGKFLRLEGIDSLISKAVNQWYLRKELENHIRANSKAFPTQIVEQFFLDFPEKPIKLGTEWSSVGEPSNFKVTGIKGSLLIISNSTIPGSALAYNGLTAWNSTLGLTETSEKTKQGTITGPEGSAAVQVNQRSSHKLLHSVQGYPTLDTPWSTMAVKSSHWSDALKEGTEYDSIKVFKFFEANDSLYENDPYYAVRKLSLLQNFMDTRLNGNYERQLLKTPNHFIADAPSHLFNKIGDVLAISADSAYAVTKYFYKTSNFSDWLQNSYAQRFIRSNFTESDKASSKDRWKKRGYNDTEIEGFLKKHEAELINSDKLLELLNNDKDPFMQKKIRPMYLWVKAKESKNNATYLVNVASKLKKLDDSYIKEGNGARYSLLVYQLLNNTREKSAAQSLLNYTINKLERFASDSLNAERYAHQNLLAGAYYMKYLADKSQDSVKALKYLSKASEYSPKSKKENSHISFYDRVFLDTKESYSKEFLTGLFDTGNKAAALEVFSEHISANPSELKEMAALYQSNFPGKDFKQFFRETVISSWDTAPAFVLNGIKGDQYALKNYAGKWLVLDFWGTWCGPCREEMPQINSFNAELKEGKHQDLQFLSIACSDSEKDVITYLSSHKFDIPAAMSDNKVEKTYKILGYPSKIIISPTGKMLQLNFQQDWRSIAKSFSQLTL